MMARQVQAARAAVRPEGVGRCGQPLAEDGREIVSVRLLLEWAFAREKASLDFDEAAPVGCVGVDSTRRIMEAMALSVGDPGSCLRVDASGGRSLPHHDAEVVASVLRNTVPWSIAVQVAELARTARVPQWDLGAPRMVPRCWGRSNQHGMQARAEQIGETRYVSRRRGVVRTPVMWVPVTVEPAASRIAAARRGYLDWWGALLAVMAGLRGVDLDLFVVSQALPAMEPWQKGG